MDEDKPQVNDENDTLVIQTQGNGTSDDSAPLKVNVKSIAQRFEENYRELDKKSPVGDLGLSNRNTLFPKETTEGNDNHYVVDEKEEDEKEEDTKEDDTFTPEEGRIANFTKETKQENEKQEVKIIGDPITAKEAGFVFDETGDLITADEADRIANLEKDTEEGNENKDNEKEDVITVEDSGLSGRIANSANDTKEENEKEGDMYTAKKEEKPDRNASLTNFKDTKEENKQLQEDVIYKFFKKADTQNLGFLTISQFAAAVRKQGFSGKDSEITVIEKECFQH